MALSLAGFVAEQAEGAELLVWRSLPRWPGEVFRVLWVSGTEVRISVVDARTNEPSLSNKPWGGRVGMSNVFPSLAEALALM